MGLGLVGECVQGACGRVVCVHRQTPYLKNIYDSKEVSLVFLLVIICPGGMSTVVVLPHAEEWLLFSILVLYVLKIQLCQSWFWLNKIAGLQGGEGE